MHLVVSHIYIYLYIYIYMYIHIYILQSGYTCILLVCQTLACAYVRTISVHKIPGVISLVFRLRPSSFALRILNQEVSVADPLAYTFANYSSKQRFLMQQKQ
jgi:hypothetical protein